MGLYSCSEKSTESTDENDLEVSQSVEEQAAIGFELNQYFQSGSEIESMTNPGDPEEDFNFDGFGSFGKVSALAKQAVKNARQFDLVTIQANLLNKTTIIIPFPVTDSTDQFGNKIRTGGFIDTDSNLVVIYKVFYEFAEIQFNERTFDRKVVYDSTAIKAYTATDDSLNFTGAQIYNLKNYKEEFALNSVETAIKLAGWQNGEPSSFIATTTSTFNSDLEVVKIVDVIDSNKNGTGTITRTLHFKDGTSSTTVYTFDGSKNGTFGRTFRDGSKVTGEFNDVEDDGFGYYKSLIEFNSHNYLSSIYNSATVNWNDITKIFQAEFFRSVRFLNGDSSFAEIDITTDEENGTSTISITRHNGANGQFTVQEIEGVTLLTGWWITYDSLYITVNGSYYDEGSGEIEYSVYSNFVSFTNGDDPIASAKYTFSPVGDGTGLITFGDDAPIDVSFNENGFGQLRKDGAVRTFNLFRK